MLLEISAHGWFRLLLDSVEPLLEQRVIGVDLEPLVVGGFGIFKFFEVKLGQPFSLVAFGPVGFDADTGLGVGQGLFIFLEGGVGPGTIGVKDMVIGINLNGFSKIFNSFLEGAGLEGLVS